MALRRKHEHAARLGRKDCQRAATAETYAIYLQRMLHLTKDNSFLDRVCGFQSLAEINPDTAGSNADIRDPDYQKY